MSIEAQLIESLDQWAHIGEEIQRHTAVISQLIEKRREATAHVQSGLDTIGQETFATDKGTIKRNTNRTLEWVPTKEAA